MKVTRRMRRAFMRSELKKLRRLQNTLKPKPSEPKNEGENSEDQQG